MARPPALSTCPRCSAQVIRTRSGALLDAVPHPLAVTARTGRPLPVAVVLDVATGRRPPVGHHPHRPGEYGCNPPPPQQLALELDL